MIRTPAGIVLVAWGVDDTAADDGLPPAPQAEPATTASTENPTHIIVDRSNIGSLILRPNVVGTVTETRSPRHGSDSYKFPRLGPFCVESARCHLSNSKAARGVQ